MSHFTKTVYTMRYRLVGPIYKDDDDSNSGRTLRANTDEEAFKEVEEFCNRPFVGDTAVEIVRLTKTVTVSDVESMDLTPLVKPDAQLHVPDNG